MTQTTEQKPTADILVVDDTPAHLQMLSTMLKERGHKVRPVPSGKLALQVVRLVQPELILLDTNMPEMNGYEVCQELKADPQLADIPVIFISANTDTLDKVKAFSVGGVDYVTKPFQFDEIEARVETHLKIRRLQASLSESNTQLRTLEQYKTDLTDMLVHDLRTPLTSLLLGLTTMDNFGDLNDMQQELLSTSIQSGNTLLGMINDLLDISKMEDGSLKLTLEEVSPADLVSAAILQVQPLAQDKSLLLKTDIATELPTLYADRSQLQRTLTNLLANACKFTPEKGTITVSVQHAAPENAFLFCVSDTGEGIPQEAFERIFEKFGQAEMRRSGHFYSTGLGLTLCKMVVEMHGGRIWVESQLGEGATFLFTLPLPEAAKVG